MTETSIPDNLMSIAILSTLIFGSEKDEFLNKLKELGVLQFSDTDGSSPTTSDTKQRGIRSRQLIRSVSVNNYGRIEVERQFTKGVEKFMVSAQTKEPIQLKALDKETFTLKEKDIKVNFQLRDVELHDLINYEIRGMKSMSKDNGAKIKFKLPPALRLTCRYLIQGMVMGKNVNEGGNAELKLTGVDVFGKVRVKVTDVQISITELHLAYTFEKLEIAKMGLMLGGLSKNDVDRLFNVAGKKYLTENMEAIAERLSEEIKMKLNEKLEKIATANILKSIDKDKVDDSEDREAVSQRKHNI